MHWLPSDPDETKKMKSSKFILPFLACACVSCGDGSGYREPEFLSEKSARFEILGEPLTLRSASDIFPYGEYILVCGHDTVSGNTFHVYSKESGERLFSAIQFGGSVPGRTYAGYDMATLYGGTMSYIDYLDNKELRFSVDDMLYQDVPTVSQSIILRPPSNTRTWSLGDSYLYHNNSYRDSLSGTSRLELYDRKLSRTVSASDEHPIENPYLGECVYGSVRGDVSPDGSKAVFGTYRGAIMEIYSLTDSIELLSLDRYIEPLVKILLRHNRRHHYGHMDQSRLGFKDIYAGNDRIYSAYDGINKVKYIPAGYPLFTRIAIFGWDGRPLELISTGTAIEKLCCDETEHTVYAMVRGTDGMLRLGRLRL